MEDRRGHDPRLNGTSSRNLSSSNATGLPSSRHPHMEADMAEFSQFSFTRALGEAMWQYGKYKDAEQDLRHINGTIEKQRQHFDQNIRLKETLESQRSKCEYRLTSVRSEYVKAASETEPILRRLNSEPPTSKENVGLSEEAARRLIQNEVKNLDRNFLNYRDLDTEMDKTYRKVRQDIENLNVTFDKEVKKYTPRTEHERLAAEVKHMNVRSRQPSVSSDTSRDYEQRIAALARDLEALKKEVTGRTKEISTMKDMLTKLKESNLQRSAQAAPAQKSSDLIKIENALEKAQEVINDQYVTVHELQLQNNAVLEGVRILNEHIEEYDKRLDGVQSSTEKFFVEVQEENNRRNTIICQAFDSMHEKIATEISTKLEPPMSPNPAAIMSPSRNIGSPNIGFPGSFSAETSPNPNTPSLGTVVVQLESQGKLINDILLQIGGLQTDLVNNNHHANVVLPNRVQQFCNEVSSTMATYQQNHASLVEKVRVLEATVTSANAGFSRHIANSDNNFRETSVHMDSVKKRFAEHRRQLDNLITAWQETLATVDQINNKYDSLREFMNDKVIPILSMALKVLPNISEENNTGNGTAPRSKTAEVERTMAQAKAPQSTKPRLSHDGDGGGGANDPIEL